MSDAAFVPADFTVPRELVVSPFRLEPLGPEHNAADYAAWMSSIDQISSTPGWIGRDWPDPSMTAEDNMSDLVGHARDFEQRQGFTYTVTEIGTGETIGCVYIYPPGAQKSGVTEPDAPVTGAKVTSWVRADRAHLDRALYDTVHAWLLAAWPFETFTYEAH
ncbi:MAG: N-acetyltransferase [Actinomycetota bacterium]